MDVILRLNGADKLFACTKAGSLERTQRVFIPETEAKEVFLPVVHQTVQKTNKSPL